MNTTYYHVTPTENADSIRERGILSSYSKSKHGAIFFVSEKKLAWAIWHVTMRHQLPATDVTIFQVSLDKEHTFPFHRHVVYRFKDVRPQFIVSSYNVIEVPQ